MSQRLKLLVVALALVSMAACSTLSTSGSGSSEPASGGSSSGGQAAQPEVQTETYENSSYYYDFSDILVPRELEFQAAESYVFDTRSFRSGVMIFTGRVVNADLINFFVNNMTKDGWTLVTSLKADKSILIFEKFNKSASIQIVDGFKSKVTIVAVEAKGGPGTTMQQPAAGQDSFSSAKTPAGATQGSKRSMKEKDLQ
ncbi:hypothetical protein M7784_12530 [Desulfovibrio aminophilus]|nr:hypothetical protein [Desulfovibrio aminophilus]MCM0756065.1 hypothetical protein [Desulfovibrio aminophilus]